MAVAPDKIEMITAYYPSKNERHVTTKGNTVGLVDGFKLVHDVFAFQGRAVHLEGEPLVSAWRRQPTLALVNEKQTITLAYAADVKALPGPLAEQVVKRLEETKVK